MDRYHIYQSIGHGECSTVYKAREKKTIQHFAFKSVDMSQKSKVLQEVRVLHSLDHPNILKFYSWFETSAHLWLLLEYCVGGDLMTLLRQDVKLPEEAVHDLACGLVRGLQFLHSKGVIYCDLKPSNILLDENGHTKLCDFGLAKKLSDISKFPSNLAKRGTPSYMAPELFEDGGVNSYASDFWALGCVLYECYTGNPPFLGRDLTSLLDSIFSDATPQLPGSPSLPFVNLIGSLLVKDPAERIQWPELCTHAFWRTKFTHVPLPHQPAFTSMIELSSKPCLSEFNSERPPPKTPPNYHENDSKGASKQDENFALGSRGYKTPVKGVSRGPKFQTKAGARVEEDKQKDAVANRGANPLRLSRIAKSNMQKKNEKENYRRPLPNKSENVAEVKIENTDMELDFNEHNEDELHDESHGSDNPTCSPQENLTPKPKQGNTLVIDKNPNQFDSPMPYTPSTDDATMTEQEASSEQSEVSATPSSLSPQLKHQKTEEDLVCPIDLDSSESPSSSISKLLWHPSDFLIRPVMPSRKTSKLPEPVPWPPYDSLPAIDFIKMSKDQFDAFNNKVLAILNSNISIADKQSLLRYLEMLSGTAEAASILTNGPIMPVLVKMLRLSKTSTLRAQVTSLIGLLIRHSTIIEDKLSHSGILDSLANGLTGKQEKVVRRFSMAALGELLFYIATQNDHSRENNPAESPLKDNQPASCWQVTSSQISLVSSMLRKGEDDMTQLYALRTIENICSQGGHWVPRFTGQDTITNLCYIFRAAGKQENIRLTAGSCLVRLACFNSPTIQSVLEKLSFKDIASALVKGNVREQQICLNLLNAAMLSSHLFTNIGRHLTPLAEDKNLIPHLLSLIEQGSEVLRGKALAFVAFLSKNSRRWLSHFFCNQRLLSIVDRLAKEKDTYVRQCVDVFLHVVASAVPTLLDAITVDVQQLMRGKRNVSRTTPKTSIHLFPVILRLLGSSSFKHRVPTHQVLLQLANLLKLVVSPFQGRDDFQITLLRVIESISAESSLIDEHQQIFSTEILPSLFDLYKGNKDGDARFLCLKSVFDLVVSFLNEMPKGCDRFERLRVLLYHEFLPLYPTLLDDEQPIPFYSQKLLVTLLESQCIQSPDIVNLNIVSRCFEFLFGDLSTVNLDNVKLCLALASAPDVDTATLSQLKVARKIGNLLAFAQAKGKEMEEFLEPTLGLCRCLLTRSIRSLHLQLPSSESENAQCVRDIGELGCSAGVLVHLSGSGDENVAVLASECVILLLQAAPREGAASFLAALPKVGAVLERRVGDRMGRSELVVVQRILQSIGYSVRQYVSRAMILALSVPDIYKIEGFVARLRAYNEYSGLHELAALVASDLQRLPRC